jgi:hypothetical protein
LGFVGFLLVFEFEKMIRWMDVNNIREMEDISLFEDFKEGKRGRNSISNSIKKASVSAKPTFSAAAIKKANYAKFKAAASASSAATAKSQSNSFSQNNTNAKIIARLSDTENIVNASNAKSSEILKTVSVIKKDEQKQSSTSVSQQVPSLPNLNPELQKVLETKTNGTSSFTTKEGYIDRKINSKLIELEQSINYKNYMNAKLDKNVKEINKIKDEKNDKLNAQVTALTNVYTDTNSALSGNNINGISITSNFSTKVGYNDNDVLLKIKQIKNSYTKTHENVFYRNIILCYIIS